MREIKFRAWDFELGRMWSNVQNTYDYGAYGNETPENFFGELLNSKFYAVMQFTGLKDAKGNDVYEGDIIKTSETFKPFFVVRFGEYSDNVEEYGYDGCGWYLDSGAEQISLARMSHINSSGFEVRDCEVAGNLYENPELLK